MLNYKKNGFGKWSEDDIQLPCFDLDLDQSAPCYPFYHLIGTGKTNALIDQWGNIKQFATSGGYNDFFPEGSPSRSTLYMTFEINNEQYSLIFGELDHKKQIRYGIGYAEFTGELINQDAHLHIKQQFFAPEDATGIIGRFTLKNLTNGSVFGKLSLKSDASPPFGVKPEEIEANHESGFTSITGFNSKMGKVFLASNKNWLKTNVNKKLELQCEIQLEKNEEITLDCFVGYGTDLYIQDTISYLKKYDPLHIRQKWKSRVSSIALETPKKCMQDEILWAAGQMFSFVSYDDFLDEYFTHIGGYSWKGLPVREVCENTMFFAYWDHTLAKSGLRWVAKTQLPNGHIPRSYFYEKNRPMALTSDNEIWFILTCCEYFIQTKDKDFLFQKVNFWNQDGCETIWEHIRRAAQWITKGIGIGEHGLINIRDGDWNDYLDKVGRGGKGESVMNSGMACRAYSLLAETAKELKENDFAQEIENSLDSLRAAVAKSFDKQWFVRGYDDFGQAIGSYKEDRLFINSQTWAILGKCGTKEQRIAALTNAIEKCHTDIGLTLMSRPYSSPAPDNISSWPVPAGEGENAGIWPQTVYWFIWALAEEGLFELALQEWECMSLRNHSRLFPNVPYGIFNGPDCYSSKHADAKEGWTQNLLLDRALYGPMNPCIAWQGFAMKKIVDGITKNKHNNL